MIKRQLKLLLKQGLFIYSLRKIKKVSFLIKLLMYFPSHEADKWKKLKNKYRGQRAFLIGNGPSLNHTPLYLLKNEKIMCFNRFHLMLERVNWKPNFYTIVDNLVLDDMLNEFDNVLKNTKHAFIPAVHPEGNIFINRIEKIKNLFFFRHKVFNPKFSTNLPYTYGGGTVIFEGFQILNYLGFKEIYFLGVDMNYKIHKTANKISSTNEFEIISNKDDDPNHFDPRYFGKGKKYHQPEQYIVNNIMNNLSKLSKLAPMHGIKIYNIGFNSKVNFFERKNFYDLLNINPKKQKKIFEELVAKKSIYKTIEDLKKNCKKITNEGFKNFDNNLNFIIDSNNSDYFIKKCIYSHLSLGPYKDQIFMISRSKLI